MRKLVSTLSLLLATAAWAAAQTRTPAQSVRANFEELNRKILAMAQDFPEDKYGYSPAKDVRPFSAVIVHLLSGNVFGARAGRGEKVQWDEMDPKNYKDKAAIVAGLKQSIDDANATLKATPDESFSKTLGPWMAVIEHAAEHYGQLVVYYRVNGLVPPESRPKPR